MPRAISGPAGRAWMELWSQSLSGDSGGSGRKPNVHHIADDGQCGGHCGCGNFGRVAGFCRVQEVAVSLAVGAAGWSSAC